MARGKHYLIYGCNDTYGTCDFYYQTDDINNAKSVCKLLESMIADGFVSTCVETWGDSVTREPVEYVIIEDCIIADVIYKTP